MQYRVVVMLSIEAEDGGTAETKVGEIVDQGLAVTATTATYTVNGSAPVVEE